MCMTNSYKFVKKGLLINSKIMYNFYRLVRWNMVEFLPHLMIVTLPTVMS